jgi:hypothetical protein
MSLEPSPDRRGRPEVSERLSAGDVFPATAITLSDGSTMSLPGDMGDGWKVIIVYRGSW